MFVAPSKCSICGKPNQGVLMGCSCLTNTAFDEAVEELFPRFLESVPGGTTECNVGWLCPRCDKILAPWRSSCDC